MIHNEERNQRKGLLINITGNGKGKTTSALGACMRALGWNWKVKMIQFIKGSRETGEKRFAGSYAGNFEMIQAGLGMPLGSQIPEDKHIEAAHKAWTIAENLILQKNVDLLVLDELNVSIDLGWLKVEDVVETLTNRPSWMTIIITGRNSPAECINISDLVSDIKEIKHPYNIGIPAQKGIDY